MGTLRGLGAVYSLDDLGWLQFERLCSELLGRGPGLVPEGLEVPWRRRLLPGPTLVVVAWVSPRAVKPDNRLRDAVDRARDEWAYARPESVLVLTNAAAEVDADVVLGPEELTELVATSPELRLRVPAVLGIYDVRAAVDASQSTLDLDAAATLARVFVATRAYARAREVLERHHFAVVTGPPEMGKTAIARTIALARLTAGWEAHECIRPEQLWERFARDRPQVFVADDAFGSTEYRPEAAERWALELDRILHAMDDRHWLIWTSRPAPLKAGLRRIHREHGVEHWPKPAEVHVDAAALDVAEKALILFRHAKAAHLVAADEVRAHGWRIVSHPHFTPERIRRFVTRLPELSGRWNFDERVATEIREPTTAMTTSFHALAAEHRALLVALLDVPPGPVSERDLVAATRRHSTPGFTKQPAEIVDRLTDHFIRVVEGGAVTWVHPSWRDLVIDELVADAASRRAFLHSSGIDGLVLALSTAGGAAGERTLPLLIEDADWDAAADRLAQLVPRLAEPEVTRLLAALTEARASGPRGEVEALARYVLELLGRRWTREVVPAGLVAEWFDLAAALDDPPEPPVLALTWIELQPSGGIDPDDDADLARLDDWVSLLGFAPPPTAALERARETLAGFATAVAVRPWQDWPSAKRERIGRLLRGLAAFGPVPGFDHGLVSDLLGFGEEHELAPVELRPLSPELERILDAPPALPRDDEAFVAKVLRDL